MNYTLSSMFTLLVTGSQVLCFFLYFVVVSGHTALHILIILSSWKTGNDCMMGNNLIGLREKTISMKLEASKHRHC